MSTPTGPRSTPYLLTWEHSYNRIRLHQALGYLTPSQYLDPNPPPVKGS